MKWFNILILIGVLGLIAVGSYLLLEQNANSNNTNASGKQFKYYSVVSRSYISLNGCNLTFPSVNNAILVNSQHKPLNVSYGKFIAMNGYYTSAKLPTCKCTNEDSKITGCIPGQPIMKNFTVFVVKDYKIITNATVFTCNTDSDCVPATCCHPTYCVNKAYKPNCKNAICTDMRVPGTLDYGKCACVDHKCVAEIEPPVTFK